MQNNVISEDSLWTVILIGCSKYLISTPSIIERKILGFDIGWSDCSAMNFSQYFSSVSFFAQKNRIFFKKKKKS